MARAWRVGGGMIGDGGERGCQRALARGLRRVDGRPIEPVERSAEALRFLGGKNEAVTRKNDVDLVCRRMGENRHYFSRDFHGTPTSNSKTVLRVGRQG